MKRLTLNLTIAAAALTVAAATASAQLLKAEIPFAFTTGTSRMLPGSYDVNVSSLSGGQPLVRLRNLDDGTSLLKMPVTREDAPKRWQAAGTAVIEFACTDGHCALARIYTGEGASMNFAIPKAKSGEHMALVVVRADRTE